jgi:hypothetical protein
MKIREHFEKLRNELRESFKYSVYDAAALNDLAIEYWERMPAYYDGHLDTTTEKPRFIAVNPDLPKQDQVYVIAREIGRLAQIRRIDSPFINRPWKWNLLATAPAEIRDLIYRLDVEVRAECVMYFLAAKYDFFGFYKRHPKKLLVIFNAHLISDFLFLKLRIRNVLCGVLSALGLVNRQPSVPIS